MSQYLFVYGTLLPDLMPDEQQVIVEKLQFFGNGWMPGLLYDLDVYPGAVFDKEAITRINGCIYRLHTDEALRQESLKALDDSEGFIPENHQHSLFIREQATIETVDGSKVECWVYVYNQNLDNASLIPSGDYAQFRVDAEHRR